MACSKCGGSKYKDYDLFCDHVVTPPKAPRSFNLDGLRDALHGIRTHRVGVKRKETPLTADYCMLEARTLVALGLARFTIHDEIEVFVGVDLATDKTAEDPSVTGTFCYPADGLKPWLPPIKEPQRVLKFPQDSVPAGPLRRISGEPRELYTPYTGPKPCPHKDHKKDPAE